MQIHYFGLSSFKIISREATIITDPFDKKSGLTPPRGAAEILILSEKTNQLYTAISGISGDPFMVEDPGEYDLKNVTVTGLPLKQDDKWVTVFLIETEDIKILNLTHIKEFNMKDDDLEALGDIDVLIIPVGGNSVMDPATAAKITAKIDPKIVVPSHYAMNGLSDKFAEVEAFIKAMGGKSESLEKIMLKKKDLATEGTKVFILQPLR